MTAKSGRIYLYWLLLLVPTLAVAAGALVLLRREQARLDAEASAARAAKQAAIAARARLIAENVELLVADVEDGLTGTLMALPARNPEAALAEWMKGNTLVQSVFWLEDDRRVRWCSDERARPWLSRWIALRPPWRLTATFAPETDAVRRLRGNIAANVSQAQSLRNSLQYEARQANTTSPNLKLAEGTAAAEERHGWAAWQESGMLHLVGWRKLATGSVVGVELNLAGITGRFDELLPRDGELAHAFAIREHDGRVAQSKVYLANDLEVRKRATPEEVVAIPLAETVLPGWEVVGYGEGPRDSRTAGGYFVVGALLVGIFVATILSAGSLLLWQARRSEAEAAQKTSFVANVSHEFKTPLTTIRLYAELLEQGRVRDEAQSRTYLQTIARETQRLARLVNNALDFSRLEQGKKKYALAAVDLTAELGRMLDTHAPRIAEAGLTLHRQLPGAAVPATLDRDALEQIVLNLIDNACKYAVPGGELTVTLETPPGGGKQIRGSDRGPGVPPVHRERIFEKFHRVDDTLTAEQGGAGLGLSIARQLARGLGGELSYAPREGGGASFILKLS